VLRVQQAVFLYRSMQLPKEETSPEQDVMPDFMKDTTVFAPDIKFDSYVLGMPLLVKVLEEGQSVVRKNNMLIIEANNGIEARSEGYKNPKDNNFRQVRISQYGTDTKSFTLRFDFRDQRAVDIATNWLEIALPEANLIESIKSKAQEANNYEKSGEYFMGNSQRIKVGDYEIKYGVSGFLEFFNFEAEYVEK
jgi:hypothetical protein